VADEAGSNLLMFRVDELAKSVLALSVRVDSGFEKLDDRLASVALIQQIEKRLDERVDGLAKSVSDLSRLTWGLFAILVTAILAVLGGLVRAFG
jgi:hypothetical protein